MAIIEGMTKRKSVVLLSGGLDSSANLAFTEHFDEPVLALTIDYGQKAAPAEIAASKKIAEYYQVPHQVLDLKWLGALGGSALTDEKVSIPHITDAQLSDIEKTKNTAALVWVPNRNGILINVAAAIAERMNALQIVVGFNKEEAETFPDNSSQFLGVATLGLRYSTRNHVKVACYTDMMVKKDIVRALRNLPNKFPFELVWSCYESGVTQCGTCESCQRLKRALAV